MSYNTLGYRQPPEAPVVGLRYRLPEDGPLRAAVVRVEAVVETPEGEAVVVGTNALGQRFERTVRW